MTIGRASMDAGAAAPEQRAPTPAAGRDLLDVASRECDEIVLAAAARIQQVVDETERELHTLKATVDAASAFGHCSEAVRSDAERTVPGPGDMLPASVAARQALADANQALTRLMTGVGAAAHPRTSLLRLRTGPILLTAAAMLLAAGALGAATGWLAREAPRAMPPVIMAGEIGTSGASEDSAPLETAASAPRAPDPDGTAPGISESPARADAVPRPTSADGPDAVAAEVADRLRQDADAWLRAYLEGEMQTSGARPSIRDERSPAERRASAAVQRTITPARVDVFGDAAVLSTSVTEPSAGAAGEVVFWVSQLWTRAGGRWQLDDVRIISAAGAEQVFRR